MNNEEKLFLKEQSLETLLLLMKKTSAKKFKVRMFYHLQNLFWGVFGLGDFIGGFLLGGLCLGFFCPVTLFVLLISTVSSCSKLFCKYLCVTFAFHLCLCSFLVPFLMSLLFWCCSLLSMNSFPSRLIDCFSCSSTSFNKLCIFLTSSKCFINPTILISYISSILCFSSTSVLPLYV